MFKSIILKTHTLTHTHARGNTRHDERENEREIGKRGLNENFFCQNLIYDRNTFYIGPF